MNNLTITEPAIGINWGSSNLRAYLFDGEGYVTDTYVSSDGVTKLDKDGMKHCFKSIVERWPEMKHIYLCGMIGSPLGLQEAPYKGCPAKAGDLVQNFSLFSIGGVQGRIIPGMKCRTSWGDSDVMRGEEVELFGLLESDKRLSQGVNFVVLPGTHCKWVKVVDGDITEFFTSVNSEIFDHLSSRGLLSSIVSSPATPSDKFEKGVIRGSEPGAALGRLLFGVRAQVMTGDLNLEDAASYARGLLIGSEIQDASSQYDLRHAHCSIPLLGNSALCNLYLKAFEHFGLTSHIVDADNMVCTGFRVIHSIAMKSK